VCMPRYRGFAGVAGEGRSAGGGARSGAAGLRDLHLGLDGTAEGSGDLAGSAAELRLLGRGAVRARRAIVVRAVLVAVVRPDGDVALSAAGQRQPGGGVPGPGRRDGGGGGGAEWGGGGVEADAEPPGAAGGGGPSGQRHPAPDRGWRGADDGAGTQGGGELRDGSGDPQRVRTDGGDGGLHAAPLRGVSRPSGVGADRSAGSQRADLRAGRASGAGGGERDGRTVHRR